MRTILLTYPAEMIALSPDGKTLAIAGRHNIPDTSGEKQAELGLWDAHTGRLLRSLWVSHPHVEEGPLVMEAHALVFTPDGHRLVVAGRHLGPGIASTGGGEVDTYDVRTGKRTSVFLMGGSQSILNLTSDARLVVSGDVPVKNYVEGKPIFSVWDVATGRLRRSLTTNTFFNATSYAQRNTLAISPDGKTLAVVDRMGDGGVGLWDMETGAKKVQVPGGSNDVLAFSPNSGALLTWNEGLQLWDTPTGTLRRSLGVRDQAAVSADFSPDGEAVVCLLADGTTEFFNARTGMLAWTFKMDRRRGGMAALAVDGTPLATNGTVEHWRTQAISQDGTTLAEGVSREHYNPMGKSLPSTGIIFLVYTKSLRKDHSLSGAPHS